MLPLATSWPFGSEIVAMQVRLIPFVNVQMNRPDPIGLCVIFRLKSRVVMISLSPGVSPRGPTSTRV
jgi:hypothetical protein